MGCVGHVHDEPLHGAVNHCVGHVHDEPLHGAVNPEEVLAVCHRVFQAWQYNPLRKGHREVDVRPKKVPDEPVLRTSIRLALG